MDLDEKFNFNILVNEKITKANKGIGVILKLAHVLPRESLSTICKSFVRSHIIMLMLIMTKLIIFNCLQYD